MLTSKLNDLIVKQVLAGRGTLTFSGNCGGLGGTWGQSFSSAAFTLAVVVRLDHTITDYGNVPGRGVPLTLMASPHLSVAMPSGGTGPKPLDSMFLDCWRILTVRNDALVRVVYIDNQIVSTTAPTTGVVEANDQLVVDAVFPGEIAELVVWDGALSVSDLSANALVKKWTVFGVPAVPRFAVPNNGSGTAWPLGVPNPTAWLDAAYPGSLFADAAATIPTESHGRVARWMDRSGNGHLVTFPPSGKTYWATGGAEQIARLPVVAVDGTSPGTFAGGNPLASASKGPFVALAVWRLTRSGGHPFRVGGKGSKQMNGSTHWLPIRTGP